MNAQADIHTPIIRCGTPECDWGFPLPDLAPWRVEKCYAEFGPDNAQMYLDLKVGTLTLWKDE